jgi:aspartyl-tRNA(Asn)/glutamyl-tRNA(Gln) amidotransferase subunit B
MVKANPNVVEDYKKGKQAALMFFVGQGMKVTKGSANPEVLKKIILEVIG